MKKKRFFWQPELSVAIIFWSLTFIVLFYGLIVTLENTKMNWQGSLFLVAFVFFACLGLRRYFVLMKKGLKIQYALPWRKKLIPFGHIEKISVCQDGILIQQKGLNGQSRHSMSKKQKKLFIEAISQEAPNITIVEETKKVSHE